MKVKVQILLLAVCFFCACCYKKYECKQVVYDYGILALNWAGQYCSEHKCKSSWRQNFSGKNFHIHGYWPASKDKSYLTCLSENKHDPYCYSPYRFNYRKIKGLLRRNMKEYWPQIGNIKNFWAYEWNKHGTCYLDITKNMLRISQPDDEIFLSYLQQTIDKTKSLKVTNISKNKFGSKSDLASQIGLQTNQFYTVCGRDNQLDEIRICYSISKPGSEKLIKCPVRHRQCKYPVYLKNYK